MMIYNYSSNVHIIWIEPNTIDEIRAYTFTQIRDLKTPKMGRIIEMRSAENLNVTDINHNRD